MIQILYQNCILEDSILHQNCIFENTVLYRKCMLEDTILHEKCMLENAIHGFTDAMKPLKADSHGANLPLYYGDT